LMVPGMIADMTPNMDATERKKITNDLLNNADSLQELHQGLEAIHREHRR